MLLMAKSTISMAIFNSFLLVHQSVHHDTSPHFFLGEQNLAGEYKKTAPPGAVLRRPLFGPREDDLFCTS